MSLSQEATENEIALYYYVYVPRDAEFLIFADFMVVIRNSQFPLHINVFCLL